MAGRSLHSRTTSRNPKTAAFRFVLMVLWKLGMRVHESLIPAAVAAMVPPLRRPSAYGVFTAAYGVSWFIGSAMIGVLYDISLHALIVFSVVAELAAIPFFLCVKRSTTYG